MFLSTENKMVGPEYVLLEGFHCSMVIVTKLTLLEHTNNMPLIFWWSVSNVHQM